MQGDTVGRVPSLPYLGVFAESLATNKNIRSACLSMQNKLPDQEILKTYPISATRHVTDYAVVRRHCTTSSRLLFTTHQRCLYIGKLGGIVTNNCQGNMAVPQGLASPMGQNVAAPSIQFIGHDKTRGKRIRLNITTAAVQIIHGLDGLTSR